MPIIDMPLDELKQYQGINPVPRDFDSFWKKSTEEALSLDHQIQLKPAQFKCSFADCFDLFFAGTKDARIYSKLIIPKNADKCPAVLWFHGYSGKAPDWTTLLSYAAQGFVVAAMDCRGQSGKSDDTYGRPDHPLRGHIIRGLDQHPQDLSFRNIFLDTVILANIVMDLDQVDPAKVCAKGGSQGGALTIACSALEPKIKKAAPAYPFLSDYKRVWQLDFRTAAYEELTDFFRRFDPLHKNEEQIFTKLGYIDIQHLAKWVKAEILMGVSLRDDVCPPSTQFAAYNKLNCKKNILLYPDFGHETLPDFEDTVFQWISDI